MELFSVAFLWSHRKMLLVFYLVLMILCAVFGTRSQLPDSGDYAVERSNQGIRAVRDVISTCNWHSLVVIYYAHGNSTLPVKGFFVPNSPLKIMEYFINKPLTAEAFSNIVKEAYIAMQQTNYLVVTENYGDFLQTMDLYFNTLNTPESNAIVHRSHWAFIHSSDGRPNCNVLGQSKFDDILLFEIDPTSNKLVRASTLMWRENRTRGLETVDLMEANFSNCRAYYPNQRFGLNGRQLTILAKQWWDFYFSVQVDPHTEKLEYSGSVLDIIKATARSLNFTFTFYPGIGLDANLSWGGFLSAAGRNDMHLAIPYYGTDVSLVVENVEATVPLLYEYVTGAYLSSPSDSSLTTVVATFTPLCFVCIFLSLIWVASIHIGMIFSLPVTERPQHLRDQHSATAGLDLFWNVLGSLFGQASIVRLKRQSGNLLVPIWAFCVLILTCLYSSCMTASIVNTDSEQERMTLEELTKMEDYRWGTTDGVIILAANLSNNAVVGGISRRLEQVSHFKINSCEGLERRFREEWPRKFVYFYYTDILRTCKESRGMTDLVIMSEYLFTSNFGFLGPMGSELLVLLSEHFLWLQDTGFMISLDQKFKTPGQKLGARDARQLPVDITVIIISVAFGIGFSLLVLFFENILHLLETKCNHVRRTRPLQVSLSAFKMTKFAQNYVKGHESYNNMSNSGETHGNSASK